MMRKRGVKTEVAGLIMEPICSLTHASRFENCTFQKAVGAIARRSFMFDVGSEWVHRKQSSKVSDSVGGEVQRLSALN